MIQRSQQIIKQAHWIIEIAWLQKYGFTVDELCDALRLVCADPNNGDVWEVLNNGADYASRGGVIGRALNSNLISDETKDQWIKALKERPSPPECKIAKTGFVFLMYNKRSGLYKIGHSKNPEFRENTLQSEEPEIELLASCLGTRNDERKLHVRFSGFRVRGEWFALSELQAETIRKEWELDTDGTP